MKKLAQGAIGTGAGTLAYTVPNGYRANINNIDICNTTTAPLTLSLHFVPTGIAVGSTNMLVPAVSVAEKSMFQWCGNQILNAGDFIQVIGSASGLTMNISGNEERVSV